MESTNRLIVSLLLLIERNPSPGERYYYSSWLGTRIPFTIYSIESSDDSPNKSHHNIICPRVMHCPVCVVLLFSNVIQLSLLRTREEVTVVSGVTNDNASVGTCHNIFSTGDAGEELAIIFGIALNKNAVGAFKHYHSKDQISEWHVTSNHTQHMAEKQWVDSPSGVHTVPQSGNWQSLAGSRATKVPSGHIITSPVHVAQGKNSQLSFGLRTTKVPSGHCITCCQQVSVFYSVRMDML